MSTTINGFHLFTVKKYSRVKEIVGTGRFISSDTFEVGGYDWKVRFYPHGKDMAAKEYVSVYLELVNHGLDVEAAYGFTLVDQSRNGEHCYGSSKIMLYTKDQDQGMWGHKLFKPKLGLGSSNYVKDDSLTFFCMVEVVQSRIRPKNFTIIPPPPERKKNFKYFLDNELGCDIVFRVKDETFKAHKLILANCSPVFKAQFYGLVGNPALDEIELMEVELMDIEPTIFQAMLLFIYSDELPDSRESTGSMSHIIQHLLVAADRFGLDTLKQLCEAKLCEELNVDVVATTLSLAHDHHCSQLKTICMEFVVANLQAVIQTEAYKDLEKSCPSLVLELLPNIAELLLKITSKS